MRQEKETRKILSTMSYRMWPELSGVKTWPPMSQGQKVQIYDLKAQIYLQRMTVEKMKHLDLQRQKKQLDLDIATMLQDVTVPLQALQADADSTLLLNNPDADSTLLLNNPDADSTLFLNHGTSTRRDDDDSAESVLLTLYRPMDNDLTTVLPLGPPIAHSTPRRDSDDSAESVVLTLYRPCADIPIPMDWTQNYSNASATMEWAAYTSLSGNSPMQWSGNTSTEAYSDKTVSSHLSMTEIDIDQMMKQCCFSDESGNQADDEADDSNEQDE
jgi:hypothetical protein